MTDEIVHVRLATRKPLDEYLDRRLASSALMQGEQIAKMDIERTKLDVLKVVERTNDFLESPSIMHDSQLVLGKVQSGKTAHMFGVIAALASVERANLVVIFAGMTDALANQTFTRLKSDLETIDPKPVRVFEAPTTKKLEKGWSDFAILSDALKNRIKYWKNLRAGEIGAMLLPPPPLVVVTVLQHPSRVVGVKELIRNLQKESGIGDALTVVLIDDEADQASQNAGESKGVITTIHRIMSEIVSPDVDEGLTVKNCLLSYTATPQAILLSPKAGALRPRLVSCIGQGSQYFGIEAVVKSRYRALNVHQIEDSEKKESAEELANYIQREDVAMREALIDFFLCGLIRKQSPDSFYGADARFLGKRYPQSDGVHMLVHPSSKKNMHKELHERISKQVADITKLLGGGAEMPTSDFVHGELAIAWQEILKRTGDYSHKLPSELPEEWILKLAQDVSNSCEIRVINSLKDDQLPVDVEWDSQRYMILVGGEILGRGVTIPQLVTTFITRTASQMQFDTIYQQMRFCGYRTRYSDMTTLWLPKTLWMRYLDVAAIGHVINHLAETWDKEGRDLIKRPPRVPYYQPASADLNPTKRGVIGRDLVRTAKRGQVMFQSNHLVDPNAARSNVSLIVETSESIFANSHTYNVSSRRAPAQDYLVSNIPFEKVRSTVSSFVLAGSEANLRDDFVTLFDDAYRIVDLDLNLGFSKQVDVAILESDLELMRQLLAGEFPYAQRLFERTVQTDRHLAQGPDAESWESAFLQKKTSSGWWTGAKMVPPVGDSQRKLVAIREEENGNSAERVPVIFLSLFKLMSPLEDETPVGFAPSLFVLTGKKNAVAYWADRSIEIDPS